MPQRAAERAALSGARIDVVALAAVRATREATVEQGRERLPSIVGTPAHGERAGRETFDGVSEVTDFVTVPPGTYLCRVADVRTGTTRSGDERWGLKLVVAEGQHVGRQATWDSIVFSNRGRARATSQT